MFIIIKGRKIADLRQLFKSKTETLFSKVESDNNVADWIFATLQAKPKASISATRLYALISNFQDRGKESKFRNPFCRECCAAEPQSATESDSDGDPLARWTTTE
ncbi:hypothetical protein V2W45_1350072 [Cenococcum geophilum]